MTTIDEAVARIKELNDDDYLFNLQHAGLLHHHDTLAAILNGEEVTDAKVLALHNLMVDAQGD